MKKPFISLTPQEALHVAIFIEERNAELYHRFAEMFTEFRDIQSLEIASVFWEMASEERHHSTQLQQRYMERHGNACCALTEDDLQEIVEVPRLETSQLFDDRVTPGEPTMRERALQVALAAELSARHFYAELAGMTSDPGLHKLYRELAEFEDDHVMYLEKKIALSSAKKSE
jgi:rubrerythrin